MISATGVATRVANIIITSMCDDLDVIWGSCLTLPSLPVVIMLCVVAGSRKLNGSRSGQFLGLGMILMSFGDLA